MLTRIKKRLQKFMGFDSLNPFSLIMDERRELMPRIYRSTFLQRMHDTLEVLLGKYFLPGVNAHPPVILSSTLKTEQHRSTGLIDILIFPLIIRIVQVSLVKLGKKLPFTQTFLAIVILSLHLPRVLLAGILTFVASPIVAGVHLFYKHKIRQLKKELATLEIIPFNQKTSEKGKIDSFMSKLDASPESTNYSLDLDILSASCSMMPIFIPKADRSYCIDKKDIKIITYSKWDESAYDEYELELLSAPYQYDEKRDKIYLSAVDRTYCVVSRHGWVYRGNLPNVESNETDYLINLPHRLNDPELKKRILAIVLEQALETNFYSSSIVTQKYAVQGETSGLKEDDLQLTNWLLFRFTPLNQDDDSDIEELHSPLRKDFKGLIPVTPENKRGIEALFKLNTGSILGYLANGAAWGERLNIYRNFIHQKQDTTGELAVLGKDATQGKGLLISVDGNNLLGVGNRDLANLIASYVIDVADNKPASLQPTRQKLIKESQDQSQSSAPSPATGGFFSPRRSVALELDEEEKKPDVTPRQSRIDSNLSME